MFSFSLKRKFHLGSVHQVGTPSLGFGVCSFPMTGKVTLNHGARKSESGPVPCAPICASVSHLQNGANSCCVKIVLRIT